MGDLVETIGPLVPAAIAARQWYQHKGEQFATEQQRTFHTLRLEMARYGAAASDRPWTADTMFKVTVRACPGCGTPMIADRDTACCSTKCGRRYLANQQKGTSVVREQLPLDDDDHPEIQALRMIDRALRQLPDQASRDRVLLFARSLRVDVPAKANGKMSGTLTLEHHTADEAS